MTVVETNLATIIWLGRVIIAQAVVTLFGIGYLIIEKSIGR